MTLTDQLRKINNTSERFDKEKFRDDWESNLSSKELAKKYKFKNIYAINKFASKLGLKLRESLEDKFERNSDAYTRKLLKAVYDYNDIGISINDLESSGLGPREKILDMIDIGYFIAKASSSEDRHEDLIFVNNNLRGRFFSCNLKKFKEMYANQKITTFVIANRLKLGDVSNVSRLARMLELTPRPGGSGEEKFTECKEKLKKLWKTEKTVSKIASELGVTVPTVFQWRKKIGLKKRSNMFYSDTGRKSIVDVTHAILKDNHGAMSAYDISKKFQNLVAGPSITELLILKHVKESSKFETMLLLPWLKRKLNPEDLPSGFVSEWRYIVDALANRNVDEGFRILANMQNDYPEHMDLIDFSRDGRIVFLQGEYDCLVLKIAKITSLHKVSIGHVRDSLQNTNLFDNSRGGAQSAMQVTLSKWDALLKNFNEKSLKKLENEIKAKISNNKLPTLLYDKLDGKSDLATGLDNVKVDKEFNNLCSKVCLEPLKEFAPKVKQFHVLSSSDTSKFSYSGIGYSGIQIEAVVNNETVTIRSCLSDTRPELLLEWAGAKANSSETHSPRDSLRQILICQRCYTDSDISFLCPHIMYVFWYFWKEDKPPFNRKEISLLLNDLWFFFKCWNPLEDILYDTILSASTDDKLSYLSALKQMITSNNRGFKRLSATYYEELASYIHAEHNQTFEFSKASDLQHQEDIKLMKKLFLEIWKHNKEMWDEILNLEQRKKMLLLSYVHVEASNS